MKDQEIIRKTAEHVRSIQEEESSGHDWWHTYRVWKTAVAIGKSEHADMLVIELAALLHDIADWKFNGGDQTAGPKAAREWLERNGADSETIRHVCDIVENISFKGAGAENEMPTIEGKVVRDADRLDAIGSIGIARVFMMGAKFNELMFDPSIPVPGYKDKNDHIAAKGKKGRTVINHFHEKLLLLKGMMATEAGKRLAESRHSYMEKYLERFMKEWEGEA